MAERQRPKMSEQKIKAPQPGSIDQIKRLS